MTQANTNARPVHNQTAKTPSLAQTVAAAKGLKPLAAATAPKEAKPVVDPKIAEGVAKAKQAAKDAAAEAKRMAQAVKDEAKAAADAAKAEAKAKALEAATAAKAEKAAKAVEAAKAKADEKAAKAAEREAARAERIAAGGKDRLVPADLTTYHVDKERKTAGGHASVDSNDELAQKLRGLSIDEVYKHAADVLKEPEADLRTKYAHLNTGMQRMNLGNRMRAAVMKVNAPAKPAKEPKAPKAEAVKPAVKPAAKK